MGGRATLTPQNGNLVLLWFLTNVLEAGIHQSIIKIHTADSQRIQLGIMMPHHLHTHTHTHTQTDTHTDRHTHTGTQTQTNTHTHTHTHTHSGKRGLSDLEYFYDL